jgi:hypothetical protein
MRRLADTLAHLRHHVGAHLDAHLNQELNAERERWEGMLADAATVASLGACAAWDELTAKARAAAARAQSRPALRVLIRCWTAVADPAAHHRQAPPGDSPPPAASASVSGAVCRPSAESDAEALKWTCSTRRRR